MKRLKIIDTPSKGEVIAVFEMSDGLRNITIKSEALQQKLRTTPTHIPNPAREPVEAAVYALAEEQAAKENA